MYFSVCFSWLLQKPFICSCWLCCLFTPFSVLILDLFSLVFQHRLFKPDFELGYFFHQLTVGRSTASLSPVFPALLLLCSPRKSGAPLLRAVMLQHEQYFPFPAFLTFVAALFLEGIRVILLSPLIITISVLWCCSKCAVLTVWSKNNL